MQIEHNDPQSHQEEQEFSHQQSIFQECQYLTITGQMSITKERINIYHFGHLKLKNPISVP